MPTLEARCLLSVLCTGWSFAHLVSLRAMPDGLEAATFLVSCIVANDVAAYFVGKIFGKTKLSPTVSPQKTVEGLIAGTIASVLCAFVLSCFFSSFGTAPALSLGLLIAALSPFGDLAVSVIKRDAGVKDAGTILPGHGGVLDRFGSFILITPIFHYCFLLLQP